MSYRTLADVAYAPMAEVRSAFGKAVRAVREELGWTQEDLAERSGLSRPYIVRIEAGERNLTMNTVDRVAKALGRTTSELYRLAEGLEGEEAGQ